MPQEMVVYHIFYLMEFYMNKVLLYLIIPSLTSFDLIDFNGH
jgi:hypothetical protein